MQTSSQLSTTQLYVRCCKYRNNNSVYSMGHLQMYCRSILQSHVYVFRIISSHAYITMSTRSNSNQLNSQLTDDLDKYKYKANSNKPKHTIANHFGSDTNSIHTTPTKRNKSNQYTNDNDALTDHTETTTPNKHSKSKKTKITNHYATDTTQSTYTKLSPTINPITPPKRTKQTSIDGTDTTSHTKQTTSSKKRAAAQHIINTYKPPDTWSTVLAGIIEMRKHRDAVVDSAGAESNAFTTTDLPVFRFQTLVSLLLSSQTPDGVTRQACINLNDNLKGGLTIQSILDTEDTVIDSLISKVGFHGRKTQYLKKTAQILHDQYNDDIPPTVEQLMELPGIGPKMAYIIMSAAWNTPVGIGVDTHVHRIAQRLQWVPESNNPETTRLALQAWLPKEHWGMINKLLVGFGQQICAAKNPKCAQCLVVKYCPAGHQEVKRRHLRVDPELNASKITEKDITVADQLLHTDIQVEQINDIEQLV